MLESYIYMTSAIKYYNNISSSRSTFTPSLIFRNNYYYLLADCFPADNNLTPHGTDITTIYLLISLKYFHFHSVVFI